MSDSVVDEELVARVQRGDKRAYDLLVRKYQSRIISLIGRYVRDSSDVYDVAQETFIKAYRALASFRGESAFYTWLYRIAINTAKNYLTAQSRRPPDVDIDVQDAEQFTAAIELKETDTPENLLLRDEIRHVIFTTIDSLPTELKTAITLRELEGMSYEDIANVMDCPVGTVRSRIFRAREAIDLQLKPLLS